jgi:hypothetical protein
VYHWSFVTSSGQRGLQLQQAAGISGGDYVGIERRYQLGFAIS